MFRLKKQYRKAEYLDRIFGLLNELPKQVPTITACEIGVKPFPMPTESPDGAVKFYDLVQIITFDSEADCMDYPKSQGHLDFLKDTSDYMEQVVGIDYPVAED